MFGEFLLETFEVHSEGVLAGNIVHAQEVIYPLTGTQRGELIGHDAKVLPADVPVEFFGVLAGKLVHFGLQILAYIVII